MPITIELRDMILGTGMTDGMEQSYLRLETEVLDAEAALVPPDFAV